MLIRRKRGWEIPEREATPEAVYNDRRRLLKAIGLGAIGAAVAAVPFASLAEAAAQPAEDPSAGLYPFKHDDRFTLDRPVTDEKLVEHYNNFYEFGSQKEITTRLRRCRSGPGPSPST